MSNRDRSGPRYDVHVGGSVTGQMATGEKITQQMFHGAGSPVTEAELAEFRRLVDQARASIAAEAPAGQRAAALDRIEELREAVVAEQPDVTTMAYVRNWFARNLPRLAGTVTGLIVNPIVGHIVTAAGELAAAEFRRLFGSEAGGGSS